VIRSRCAEMSSARNLHIGPGPSPDTASLIEPTSKDFIFIFSRFSNRVLEVIPCRYDILDSIFVLSTFGTFIRMTTKTDLNTLMVYKHNELNYLLLERE